MNADPLFHALDDYLATVAAQLAPGQRRKLTREVAIGLRKRQQQRINSQKTPAEKAIRRAAVRFCALRAGLNSCGKMKCAS